MPPNAALQYWQGFAVLPQMDPAQRDIVEHFDTAELNAQVLSLIEASTNSLRQLHRGAAIDECDWGLNKQDGLMLLLPHLGKARELARLACLRARLEFQHGDPSAALEDLGDAIVLARQGGAGSTLIAILVQDSIEQMAVEVAGDHLISAKGPALKHFGQRLAQLPPGGSLSDSARLIERQFGLDWLIQQLKNVKPGEDWRGRLEKMFGNEAGASELIKSSKSPEDVIARLEASRPYYGQIPPLLDLPPDEFRTKAKALYAKYSSDAWGKMMLPDYSKVYDKQMSAEVRLAMLRAAIAVIESGPDALKGIPDPAERVPFQYETNGKGFILRSNFSVGEKPVILKLQS
ncbi:MAG TPA: hypothetical protein VFW23_18315 [Tepidisphaeraceae bacterium]|nr:hypothetical protein [Tepidisphaeraceae bacterium]